MEKKSHRCDEVMIYHEVSGEELELTVYFEIEDARENIDPICNNCGKLMEPWPLIKIGKVVKILDTTDTTNQGCFQEKIFSKEHSSFKDVVEQANDSYRHCQEHPDGVECNKCMEKSSTLDDILLWEELTNL